MNKVTFDREDLYYRLNDLLDAVNSFDRDTANLIVRTLIKETQDK